jgi:hypothetical protein
MAFEIATGEARWSAARHPMLGFFRHTHHPDIDIGQPPAPLRKGMAEPRPVPAVAASAEDFALV